MVLKKQSWKSLQAFFLFFSLKHFFGIILGYYRLWRFVLRMEKNGISIFVNQWKLFFHMHFIQIHPRFCCWLEFIYNGVDIVVTWALMVEGVQELQASTKRFSIIGNHQIMWRQVGKQHLLRKKNIKCENYIISKVCHPHEVLLIWKMVVVSFVSSLSSSLSSFSSLFFLKLKSLWWKLLLLTKNNLNSSIWQRGHSKSRCDYGFCRHMWSKVIGKMC